MTDFVTRDHGKGTPLPSPAADPEVQETLDDLARYRGLLKREKVESTRQKLGWSIAGMERWLENARRRV